MMGPAPSGFRTGCLRWVSQSYTKSTATDQIFDDLAEFGMEPDTACAIYGLDLRQHSKLSQNTHSTDAVEL